MPVAYKSLLASIPASIEVCGNNFSWYHQNSLAVSIYTAMKIHLCPKHIMTSNFCLIFNVKLFFAMSRLVVFLAGDDVTAFPYPHTYMNNFCSFRDLLWGILFSFFPHRMQQRVRTQTHDETEVGMCGDNVIATIQYLHHFYITRETIQFSHVL